MPAVPSARELSDFYATYNDTYSGGGASGGANLARYARRYLELVREHAGTGRLIDVGSSNSPFPDVAASVGFDTTVMDFTRPAGLSERVDFVAGNINEGRIFEGGQDAFDVVTCWAVMEHLPDPRRSAGVLAGLCRPGGILLLSTPEIGTLLTRWSLGRSPWFYPPEHLCLVSPQALGRIFEPLGCDLLQHSRLELTRLRYLARYGIGVAEAAVGWPVKRLAPHLWEQLRDSRRHAFQGVSCFVLRKRGQAQGR